MNEEARKFRESLNPKRKIKNGPSTKKGNFKNEKLKRIIALLGVGVTIGTAGLMANHYNANKREALYNFDLEESIVEDAERVQRDKEKKGLWNPEEDNAAGYYFDEDGNFVAKPKVAANRTQLYNLLSSTDLDQLVNKYLTAPEGEEKDQSYLQISDRLEELVDLNMNMIKASIADSTKENIEDIKIDVTAVGTDDDRRSFAKGSGPCLGLTLRVNGLSAMAKQTGINFEQIPEGLYNLLVDARLQQEAPDCSYWNERDDKRAKEAKEENPFAGIDWQRTNRQKVDDAIGMNKAIESLLKDNILYKDGSSLSVKDLKTGEKVNISYYGIGKNYMPDLRITKEREER